MVFLCFVLISFFGLTISATTSDNFVPFLCPLNIPNGRISTEYCTRTVSSTCCDLYCNTGCNKQRYCLTCQGMGEWDRPELACSCPDTTTVVSSVRCPFNIQNGYISSSCSRGASSSCLYHCNDGCSKVWNSLTCQSSGYWYQQNNACYCYGSSTPSTTGMMVTTGTPPPTTTEATKSLPPGSTTVIIGCVVGATVILVLVFGCCLCCGRRRSKSEIEIQNSINSLAYLNNIYEQSAATTDTVVSLNPLSTASRQSGQPEPGQRPSRLDLVHDLPVSSDMTNRQPVSQQTTQPSAPEEPPPSYEEVTSQPHDYCVTRKSPNL